MEELQRENTRLKALIESFQQENTQLQRLNSELKNKLRAAEGTISKLQTECRKIELSPTHIILDTIKYLDAQKPTITINCFKVQLENSSVKEAQLAKIICQPRNLAKIAKSSVSVETIYDWYKDNKDWFDLTSEERSTFEKSLYNSFRRLNDKFIPFFRDKKLFIKHGKIWSFNEELEIIPTTPKS